MENTEKLIFEVSLKITNPENPEKNFETGVRFEDVENSKHFTRSQFSQFIQKEISTHFAIAVAECEDIPLDVKMAFAEIDNQRIRAVMTTHRFDTLIKDVTEEVLTIIRGSRLFGDLLKIGMEEAFINLHNEDKLRIAYRAFINDKQVGEKNGYICYSLLNDIIKMSALLQWGYPTKLESQEPPAPTE